MVTGLRRALVVAFAATTVLTGAVACGGSSTVTAPTTAVDGGDSSGDAAQSSGPTSLPQTAPGSATAPSGYPGPPTAAVSEKDKQLVAKMRAEGLVASDETIIGAAQYTCNALTQSNPRYLDTLVKGMIGPSRAEQGVPPQEADRLAGADAGKLIAEAKASYCKN